MYYTNENFLVLLIDDRNSLLPVEFSFYAPWMPGTMGNSELSSVCFPIHNTYIHKYIHVYIPMIKFNLKHKISKISRNKMEQL